MGDLALFVGVAALIGSSILFIAFLIAYRYFFKEKDLIKQKNKPISLSRIFILIIFSFFILHFSVTGSMVGFILFIVIGLAILFRIFFIKNKI